MWTRIVAFDKRAEALKESVAKGEQVQVVGYKHLTDRKMKDGSTKARRRDLFSRRGTDQVLVGEHEGRRQEATHRVTLRRG